MSGRATWAPSARLRPATGGAYAHSRSWDRVGNEQAAFDAGRRQPVLHNRRIDQQSLEVAVAAENPGIALESQDQAGVIADRVIRLGVMDQQQCAVGFRRAVQQVWQFSVEPG